MGNVSVFVDESGIIAKHKSQVNNYFIITLLFVRDEDINVVKNSFKKYRLQIAKRKQELMDALTTNKEIKGSAVSEADKQHIYEHVIAKCGDKFEIGIIMLNNRRATKKFRSNSSRAFNYLIKLYLQKVFVDSDMFKDLDKLSFFIDERNVATESKYTLQEYLNTELNLLEHFCNDEIVVHYYDSKKFILLQMADFISNTCYRKWQKKFDDSGNVKLLLRNTLKGKPFRFPFVHKNLKTEYTDSATE
ncbi:MAG: DUF3800 domain-containing protein [Lachnospiraceae bacterium]|nr:DUF3800 domain-containing protein [Lachnospiraceae bacterium]